MCNFTRVDPPFSLSGHHFEFMRVGDRDELGLRIVNLSTGAEVVRRFLGNHAYRIVGENLEVGTIDLSSCTPVTDDMRWPVTSHVLAIKGNDIIGIGDIRDGARRYSFKFNLTDCAVRLGYIVVSREVTFTFACRNPAPNACNPLHDDYNPNPCFRPTRLPQSL